MQGWDLERKIQVTQTRLLEWYNTWDGQCYVSFSGGKDSTVLADLAARVCKLSNYKLILWFSNTGLEFPEIVKHAKMFPDWLKDRYDIDVELIMEFPKDKNSKRITFKDVINKYGYPVISKEQSSFIYEYRTTKSEKLKFIRMNGNKYKRGKISDKWRYLVDAPFMISDKCCRELKKKPAKQFEKQSGLKPIVGTMASESMLRKTDWLRHGCNAFQGDRPKSKPLSFWTDQDILQYIDTFDIPISTVYGEVIKNEKGKYITTGRSRTGCMWCAYGCHLEKEPNRFQQLKITHPKIWEYCMKPIEDGGLGMKKVLEYINVKIE